MPSTTSKRRPTGSHRKRGEPLGVPHTPYGAKTEKKPVALFVLGMGRSGTSALTRVISLCGAALPPRLLGADASNPLGLWEPRDAMDINEEILYRRHSGWADPSLRIHEESASPEENAACIKTIAAFFATLPAEPLVVIKEPRISLLFNVWFEAARRAGFDVAIVIAVRHPDEVIKSLATRDRASQELASALWLKYSLLAERQTRGLPRVFVDYANFLKDWRAEIARVSTALAIDFDTRDERAIEEFLNPGLRREQSSGSVTDTFGTDWLSATYEALHAAAQDEVLDQNTLDRVFDAFRAGEHDFRTALEDFDEHFSLNTVLRRALFRPSIAKRLRAVVAFVTRLGFDPYQRRYAKQQGLRTTKPAEIAPAGRAEPQRGQPHWRGGGVRSVG
ncbi:sulfotransferase family protein [Mycobacterium sp. HNNTM2301]|uniref:sulfotransferase family protein n=1 Tax=Mycobacterium hainanense TaxID=3289775 RepID=UPI0035A5E60C